MNEPIHSYMKVGLVHFMAYPSVIKGEGPIEETFRKIALDEYFEAVEVTWIRDADVRKRVKKMIDTSHISVAYCGHPRQLTTGLNINDLDESARQKTLATLREGIDEAYELGADCFSFLSGKYEESTLEQAYKALLASTKELCTYAKSMGNIQVALEVFDYDIDKKALIGPVALAKRFAEEMTAESNNFGLMVDLSHIPLLHETCVESLVPIKEYIVHAHMGNCFMKEKTDPAYGDAHPRFGYPGSENDVDELVEYLRLLKSIGFLNKEKRPIVSFEVKPVGDEDPDLVVANAKRVLNRAWNKV
jgi:sugar phosphate isomerase/epimerase